MIKSQLRLHAFGKACHLAVENGGGQGEALLRLCQSEIERLESKFSAYRPESLIGSLNQFAGTGSFIELDDESRSLFEFIDALWQKSKHLFDPTTRILHDCYDESGQLRATPEQLQGMLKLVGWRQLEVTTKGAHLDKKGMLLDLNNCIRPYVVDSVRNLLLEKGVNSALIDMEQDIATIGKQPDGSNWLVAARIPAGERAAITRIKLNNAGFSIRGDFEQVTIKHGERFGRALSPVDGQPIPGLLSIAVIADNCLAASSAANIGRLRTEASGIRWLNSLEMPWLAVDRHLNCHGPIRDQEAG